MMFLETKGETMAAVHRLSKFEIKGCQVSFLTPNVITLFYNKAWKEYEAAKDIFTDVIEGQLIAGTEVDLTVDTLCQVYDYFEHIQSSVISIYSAIEALCNVAIPTNYTVRKKNNKGITEIWDKAAIEKWMSTEEKAGVLVPEILKIDSPKKLPVWERFKQLKSIRDAIIHQKASLGRPSEVEADFLGTLLNPAIERTIMSGFELVQYFCKNQDKQVLFPILGGEIQVDVRFVEMFDGSFQFTNSDRGTDV